jgi:amino acid transporter
LNITDYSPGDAYNFILDVMGYPNAIVALFVTIGQFILRYRAPELHRPFKIWLPIAYYFLAAQIFLIVTPFIQPTGGKGDTSLPYWAAPALSIVLLLCGVMYWFVWLVALPRIGGFTWIAKETQLVDGTVLRTWKVQNISNLIPGHSSSQPNLYPHFAHTPPPALPA